MRWIVLGAGFAGLAAARRLTQLMPGAQIALLDAGRIAEGAVRLDDQPQGDPALLIALTPGEERKLSLGRKRHAVLRGV